LTSNPYVIRIANLLSERVRIPEPKKRVRAANAPAQVRIEPIENIPLLENDLASHHRLGLSVFVATMSVIVFWAGIMPIAGAIVVGGTFVVHSSTKRIQHKTGGVVQSIPIHDGSKVKAGEVLMVLDDTAAKAEALAIAQQIEEMQLRIARLTAERDGASAPAPVKFLTPDDHFKMAKSELDFFKTRRQTQQSIRELSESRIFQLQRQIVGIKAQLKTNKRQKEITGTELSGMEKLFEKKIAPIQRLTPLQREQARLEGSDNVLESQQQETIDRIDEIKLQLQQSIQSFHAEVIHDLTEASARVGQLLQQFIVLSQTLDRTKIIAPVSGVVNELNVHTVGGVVAPGEMLMTIVPADERLEVAVRLASDKIDQTKVGQRARVKLTAFERTTPDIEGEVSFISPDLVETKAGSYYDVRIAVEQQPRLAPGMPAEVFIETDKRTMLSYLVKPVTENLARAFRER
jgi:HlyD family secretion protein